MGAEESLSNRPSGSWGTAARESRGRSACGIRAREPAPGTHSPSVRRAGGVEGQRTVGDGPTVRTRTRLPARLARPTRRQPPGTRAALVGALPPQARADRQPRAGSAKKRGNG